MSLLAPIDLAPGHPVLGAELVVEPVSKDLGGFSVRRALPSVQRRLVGPFVFLDHMGPATFHAGEGLDVRPHPHIGLATVTYVTEGAILHRDTLGSTQSIVPGDVNWMVAGRGIAHSERSDATERQIERRMAGLQSWVALPRAHEEAAPGFFHHPAATLPHLTDTGVSAVVVAGTAYGATAPVQVFSPTLYADLTLQPGVAAPLPQEHAERAVYVLAGEVTVAGDSFGAHKLLVFRPGDAITLRAGPQGARLLLVGGEPLEGPRHLWWNFVSSDPARIEQAKDDWRAGRFGVVPGDEREFIPLPA
jgi:redox-sensitive bicupin YhaK (pirin superfamily)